MQQPSPALAPDAMAAPINRQAGLVASPASPSQEHSTESARRSYEQPQRPPYEQHVGPHCIMESRSWVEADAGPAAPRAVPQMRALDGAHRPVWREAQGDGDMPRAATKRPKNEPAADAQGIHTGARYHSLGEPQSSDDAASPLLLTSAHDRWTPPAASPLQEPLAVGVRATPSQSSEIGVAPRRPQEPRATWTAFDADSFNSPVSLSTTAVWRALCRRPRRYVRRYMRSMLAMTCGSKQHLKAKLCGVRTAGSC